MKFTARVSFGLLVFLLVFVSNYSTAQPPNEYQVKAAYLFNFGKFVRWQSNPPLSADLPFSICVLGQNPFGQALDTTVAGEMLNGRKVRTRRLANIQDGADCQIIFISASEDGRLKAILAGASRLSALTVSDIPHFAERGGMIELLTQDERVRFAVNLATTEEAGLALSSDLLKVATKVIGGKALGN
ncbi:MAG: YfiR family protein [Acidobacteriota bacterium]|nr:YfiR family protein [Acidobacteriota bacterium]